MGDPKGFLNIKRKASGYRPVTERVADYREVEQRLSETQRQEQASRCMDCGVPFCHWACPVENVMPEWQDSLYHGDWKTAAAILQSTNNFPEFTGRVCPALCEASCVLGLGDEAVTIRENELAVIEKAFEAGYISPQPPHLRTGQSVAVIGSGPAGLACADMLNRNGHQVTVFEQDAKCGGLLRYGIPDFKLDKQMIDRRLALLEAEGIVFKTGVCVGQDLPIATLQKDVDAICLTIGARQPRDLQIPGRELNGIYFAMEYLTQQNRTISKESQTTPINARGKHVLVIGGGDTGSDCVGTANRQGAASITQIEIMPKPPECRTDSMPWPKWPTILKSSSSHLEGGTRQWNILTKSFEGKNNQVAFAHTVEVQWAPSPSTGRLEMTEVPGTNKKVQADLVFLSMGFVHPVHAGLLDALGIDYDARGNIATKRYATSQAGVFSAGDAAHGASLVVWAIAEGRGAAVAIDDYLKTKG